MTSVLGPTFHAVLYAAWKDGDRPKDYLATLWIPSFLSMRQF